jgi:Protein of unknown function (DUF3617)
VQRKLLNARDNSTMKTFRSLIAAIAVAAICGSAATCAQTPGEWKYTISTDMKSIPEDMRVNFPTVSFSACRSAEDFASARAFSLQTLASSEARCPSANFKRSEKSMTNAGDAASFEFACDEGKTLRGQASGRIATKRFQFEMVTDFPAPVSGVSTLQQTMRAVYVGPCKVKPDQDELKVP